MDKYEHLKLPLYVDNIERQKKKGGGGYQFPSGREKEDFTVSSKKNADLLVEDFSLLKKKFAGKINPSLIYEIEINQSVYSEGFDKILLSMGIHVIAIAEGKKGYWVVFSDDETLTMFKSKLSDYGSETGFNHDFFNAIESFQDIPIDKKIGKTLIEKPLTDVADFIDLELWRMTDLQKNKTFIQQLRDTFTDYSKFHITDELITKSFVLLRVKITNEVFNEIINLKEIARADRPAIPLFSPFETINPEVQNLIFNEPPDGASGILIIDSGIVSNHPMLGECVGGEENFQSVERELQDKVGHGTAVAGCAAYGDIEECLNVGEFSPKNWIFSAKVMFAERNEITGEVSAKFDPEKLIEHQLLEAVESFLSNETYNIKAVNISLGNTNEVWHKNYFRQLPLASLIDELAFNFPWVVFIVSAGNHNPRDEFDTISEIVNKYPIYLINNENYKLINPATSALALTIGSIAGKVRTHSTTNSIENIFTPIAIENQPSPFTRTGPGVNGMVKPELVEYGGNQILSESHGRIYENIGGRIAVLNNNITQNIVRFDFGSSYSAPKVACLAGSISNVFPNKSANFIKNLLLVGSDYPFTPGNYFYGSLPKKMGERKFDEIISDSTKGVLSRIYRKSGNFYYLTAPISIEDRIEISNSLKANDIVDSLVQQEHLSASGYGISDFDKAVHSFNNRIVLWDEGKIGLDQVRVYSLDLPDIYFTEKGRKKITIVLTFNPETRSARGDSYLGNRMEFHLFHSINPKIITEKYGIVTNDMEENSVPEELKKFEIDLFPGANIRKAGCHQKAWVDYKQGPQIRTPTISLALLNYNKWQSNPQYLQDYCISVTFEHEKEIELYNSIRVNIQTRVRVSK